MCFCALSISFFFGVLWVCGSFYYNMLEKHTLFYLFILCFFFLKMMITEKEREKNEKENSIHTLSHTLLFVSCFCFFKSVFIFTFNYIPFESTRWSLSLSLYLHAIFLSLIYVSQLTNYIYYILYIHSFKS